MCLSSEAMDKEVQLPVTCYFNCVHKVQEGKINHICRVGKYEENVVNKMGYSMNKFPYSRELKNWNYNPIYQSFIYNTLVMGEVGRGIE